jgi:hypothetical protein
MAWSIVQQPNGLLARYSEVVEDFTDYNLTLEEAEQVCSEYLGRLEAQKKVQRGIDAGQARFTGAIETIRQVHGKNVAERRQRQMSTPVKEKKNERPTSRL